MISKTRAIEILHETRGQTVYGVTANTDWTARIADHMGRFLRHNLQVGHGCYRRPLSLNKTSRRADEQERKLVFAWPEPKARPQSY